MGKEESKDLVLSYIAEIIKQMIVKSFVIFLRQNFQPSKFWIDFVNCS